MSSTIYDLFSSPVLVLESDINDKELSDTIKKGMKSAKFLLIVIGTSIICAILFSITIYGFEVNSRETILLLYFGLIVSCMLMAISVMVGLINIYLYLVFIPLIKDRSSVEESMSEIEVLLDMLSDIKQRDPNMINDVINANRDLSKHDALASRVMSL